MLDLGKSSGDCVGFTPYAVPAERSVNLDVFAAEPFDGVSALSNLVEEAAAWLLLAPTPPRSTSLT
jgi:hypothetical protein